MLCTTFYIDVHYSGVLLGRERYKKNKSKNCGERDRFRYKCKYRFRFRYKTDTGNAFLNMLEIPYHTVLFSMHKIEKKKKNRAKSPPPPIQLRTFLPQYN